MTWTALDPIRSASLIVTIVASGCFSESEPVAPLTTGAEGSDTVAATGAAETDDSGGDDDSGEDASGGSATQSDSGADMTGDAGVVPPGSVLLYGGPSLPGNWSLDSDGLPVAYIDGQCQMPAEFDGFGCTDSVALIAVDDLDAGAGVNDGAVYSADGVLIANSVPLLRMGNFVTTPAAAGVLTEEVQFWTGRGAQPMASCVNWTGVGEGTVGSVTTEGPDWLDAGSLACTESVNILCACWPAASP